MPQRLLPFSVHEKPNSLGPSVVTSTTFSRPRPNPTSSTSSPGLGASRVIGSSGRSTKPSGSSSSKIIASAGVPFALSSVRFEPAIGGTISPRRKTSPIPTWRAVIANPLPR